MKGGGKSNKVKKNLILEGLPLASWRTLASECIYVQE